MFDFSSKNLDFLPKNDKNWARNWHFVHFGPGLAGSFGGLVGGCGARAVSRKTPIYFIYFDMKMMIVGF